MMWWIIGAIVLLVVGSSIVALGALAERGRRQPPRLAAHRGVSDEFGAMARLVMQGVGTWAAHERGECILCGHDWQAGEVIGLVSMAYVRTADGGVLRKPGNHVVCALCVDKAREQGDPSVQWAREAGVL